jgi:hypothetical protein
MIDIQRKTKVAKDKTLVRVELEYSDGKVVQLTGDDATIWNNACHAQAVMSFVHGKKFPEVDWKVIRPATVCGRCGGKKEDPEHVGPCAECQSENL